MRGFRSNQPVSIKSLKEIMTTTTLEEAIKYLKYNEVLVANVPVNESEEREIVLVATIDEGGNGIIWQDASPKAPCQSTDVIPQVHDVGISCHLRTKKWILPMLNDTHRNDLYASSIKKACETVVQRIATQSSTNGSCSRKTIHVLDIGSGKHGRRNIFLLSTLLLYKKLIDLNLPFMSSFCRHRSSCYDRRKKSR